MTLSKAEYLNYLSQTIIVTIKATDQSDITRFNEVATFSIFFDGVAVVTSECKQSELLDPSPALSTLIIELMTSAIPTSYTFPTLEDSGTASL